LQTFHERRCAMRRHRLWGDGSMTVVLCGDCSQWLTEERLRLQGVTEPFALTFLDPPFNQGKDYALFDDELPPERYWQWLEEIRFCASCGKRVGRCRTSSSGRSALPPCPMLGDMAKPTKSSPSRRRGESHALSIAFALMLLCVLSIAMSGRMGCSSPMSGTTFGS
jgi:hypothetical protein